MASASQTSALDYLRDAASDADFWPNALALVSSAFGGVGAACFATNDQAGGVEWAFIHGPAASQTSRYIEHYAPLDLFLPRLREFAPGKWMSMGECLSKRALQRSEWYQDFMRASHVADVVGAQVCNIGHRRIYFGVHFDRVSTGWRRDAGLSLLSDRIRIAAETWQGSRSLALNASLGTWSIDQSADALFVVCDGGRVVEMNRAAEHLLARSPVLTVERGRLSAPDAADAESLLALMAAAESDVPGRPGRRTLIGAAQGRRGLMLTGSPLPDAWPQSGLVVLRATDLFADTVETGDLRQVFGLSPAEDRLARALLRGRTLQEMAAEFGVSLPTLRVQVRSVFRKCGVKRQVDLVRVLLRAS